MLSPKLLEILRSWWRVEKPKQWLFPGDIPGQHISRDAVGQACQKACRLSQASRKSHFPAHILFGTPSRFTYWNPAQMSDHSAVARTPQPGNYCSIPADRNQQGMLGLQSSRPASSSHPS